MTHTKGPWVAIGTDPAEGGDWFWINAQPNPAMRGFSKNIGVVNGSQSDPEQEANARRIVACVNALEDFDIAAIEAGVVKELVEAVQIYMAKIGQGYEAHNLPFGPSQQAADTALRAALAKIGGAL